MADRIHPVRVNHMNVVLEDYDASVAHFRDLYGAEHLMDLRKPDVYAGIINIGDVLFELFVPPVYLLNARYGPHYVGVEYQANMTDVRRVLADRGIRIVRDADVALHTHPADCHGIAFEFIDMAFHDYEWPLVGGRMKPPAYWRNEHPLGLAGLKGYTVAVADLDAARAFMETFLNAKVVYDALRPHIAAHAIGLKAGDAVIELLTPTGGGALQRHVSRHGEGIRSTIFAVRDLAQARGYFAARNIPVVDGAAPNSFAVPAEANFGLIFEFAE
jgi:hypothetical protein